jgi:hypothetical protein
VLCQNKLDGFLAQGAVTSCLAFADMELFPLDVVLSTATGYISVEWVRFVCGGGSVLHGVFFVD